MVSLGRGWRSGLLDLEEEGDHGGIASRRIVTILFLDINSR